MAMFESNDPLVGISDKDDSRDHIASGETAPKDSAATPFLTAAEIVRDNQRLVGESVRRLVDIPDSINPDCLAEHREFID